MCLPLASKALYLYKKSVLGKFCCSSIQKCPAPHSTECILNTSLLSYVRQLPVLLFLLTLLLPDFYIVFSSCLFSYILPKLNVCQNLLIKAVLWYQTWEGQHRILYPVLIGLKWYYCSLLRMCCSILILRLRKCATLAFHAKKNVLCFDLLKQAGMHWKNVQEFK